ncbi:MAG: S8 family peptidase [Candidatus Caldarchaeum sp.]|nr:S8 family peptidase [Candidatus Caldarchaeum sp.]
MVSRSGVLLLISALLLIHPIQIPTDEVVDAVIEHGPNDLFLRDIKAVQVVEGLSTAKISTHQIKQLLQSGYSVYRPRTYKPLLDVSIAEIGIPEISNITGINVPNVDGRGVLIAIVDTGVDYTHPAFMTPDGRSRILYIWDQTVGGKPPTEFGYGYECVGEEIRLGTCPQRDTVGHGTIVASVAAGGIYGDWRLRGVAPGAELIVVKTGGPACGGRRWFFNEKGLLDGIAYAVTKSFELNRRLVVVLSLGTDIGAHDGSTPMEKALEKWAERGVLFVVAAGNSANDSRHVEGTLTSDEELVLRWTIPSETTSVSISFVTHPKNRLQIKVTNPVGTIIDVPVNGSKTTGRIKVESSETSSGLLKEVLVEVSSDELPPGIWRLTIKPLQVVDGRWHAWIQSDTCDEESESFIASSGYEITPAYTVTIPGTAKKVLTVGAYTTKTRWTASGQTWNVFGEVGRIEFYSGRGPTSDGRVKPDVTAPGGIVVGARSKDAPTQSFSPGRLYAVSRGTSMAAPHVAGVAALILQLGPSLTVDQVIALVKGNARTDDFTGDIGENGSNVWGWGKVNAAVAVVFEAELNGKVSEAKPTIYLNGTALTTLTSPMTVKIVLLKNTVTNITVSTTYTYNSTTYLAEPQTAFVTAGTAKRRFTISAFHRITIIHPNGTTLSSTWEKEGDVIDLGGKFAGPKIGGEVVGYVDERGVRYSGKLLEVTRPMQLVLVLEEWNILVPIIGALVTIASSAALVILLVRLRPRKSLRKEKRYEAFADNTPA